MRYAEIGIINIFDYSFSWVMPSLKLKEKQFYKYIS